MSTDAPLSRTLALFLALLLVVLLAVLLLSLIGSRTDACGPYPPVLLVAEEGTVLAAPVVSLVEKLEELEVIVRPEPRQLRWQEPGQRTAEVDRSELGQALVSLGQPARERTRLVLAHARFRHAVLEHLAARRTWKRETRYWRQIGPPPPPPRAKLPPVPAGLPAEFGLYLRGAAEYHGNRIDEARTAWQALLELPAEERRHRSVWAAYMLGRTALDQDPNAAERWFLRTRELAGEGYADALDLARDALGWLGRIALDRGHPARALGFYARQAGDGKDRRALQSLRIAADRLAGSGPEELAEAAADPVARRAFTAYLMAYPGHLATAPEWPRLWREAGEEPLPEATLQARGAYAAGRFDEAQRWLEAAPEDDPMALWLRGKLLVRGGELERAAETLRRAAAALPEDPSRSWRSWRPFSNRRQPRVVAAEARLDAGLVELARGRFEKALGLFVQADDGEDAIYVAERVLTPDELRSWIDREAQAFQSDPRRPWNPPLESRLRWLLARRLVRDDRIDEALPYFPPVRWWSSRSTLSALADRLRDALVCGRGEAQGDECRGADRADGYWQAALLTRYNGRELRSTTLGPDWSGISGGNLDLGSITSWVAPRRVFRFLPATDEELDRVARHGVEPPKRWHYRYVAAELAWRAARLLPDGSDRKATILATAGSWLKRRDPEAADRFYKALVRCCRNTEPGRKADELRWFPPLDPPCPGCSR